MKLMFPRLTAALFDAMFDTARSTTDSHKAANDILDRQVDDPLRHIDVEVNDAMLAVGLQAANDIETYGDPALYEDDRIYRAYVAMERARLVQAVVAREARSADEE